MKHTIIVVALLLLCWLALAINKKEDRTLWMRDDF